MCSADINLHGTMAVKKYSFPGRRLGMTTSPRVALCVVLGSWGALLVAAGVAGERQTHSSSHRTTSHRLCQAPLAAGVKIRGATALAGIHLDYLYTDDACGHSAPLPACG